MALQMNWFKRYINYKYDDFWTLTLDKLFKVNPQNQISILNYGSEFFTTIIENCKYDIIKIMLQNLQNFLQEFVTDSEVDDIRFIFQPTFDVSTLCLDRVSAQAGNDRMEAVAETKRLDFNKDKLCYMIIGKTKERTVLEAYFIKTHFYSVEIK